MREKRLAGKGKAKRDRKARQAPREPYHHGDLRAALVRAAEAELGEKGVEGFTLRGCAKRAGVSHAAPAHHFGDADGLLTALAAEGFRRFTAAMQARIAQDSGLAPVDAAGLGYLDFALTHPALFRLMFTSRRLRRTDAGFAKAGEEAFSTLVTAMSGEGASPLESSEGRADLAAAWALAHGLSELMLSGRLAFLGDPAGAEERDAAAAAVFRRLALARPGGTA